MTEEQWTTIGTIVGIILSILTIITVIIGVLKWLWRKIQNKRQSTLSKEEIECICDFDKLDGPLEWSEGMEKKRLKICERLVKKGYFEEWSSSPSRVMAIFGLSDKGKSAYKKLLLSSNPQLLQALQSANKIFLSKIASKCNISESQVGKIVKMMEDEGQLIPKNSDNRGTLFWVHKQ